MGEVKIPTTPAAPKKPDTILQVCICTLGQPGIDRIAEKDYPIVNGVEHLVFLQQPNGKVSIPQKITNRQDFRIIPSATRGIAVNRNLALFGADAPIAMITDDDVVYTEEDYLTVIQLFEERPTTLAISTRYRSANYPKTYPDKEFDWREDRRHYHLTAFELAVRPQLIREKIRFNEHFGFHTDFLGGEDDIFYYEAIRRGLDCRFVPVEIGRHDHPTTSVKSLADLRRIETKGAIVSFVSPFAWPFRLIAHLCRETSLSPRKNPSKFFPITYLRAWFRGRKRAKELKIFRF